MGWVLEYLEAGVGIEPAYTALQAAAEINKIKDLHAISVSHILETCLGKPHTAVIVGTMANRDFDDFDQRKSAD
jgi:hypothetical protein